MWRNLRTTLEFKRSFNRAAERHDGRDSGIRSATFWVIWPLVVLGCWGVVTRRHHRIVALAAVIAAYFTLASLVFVALPRLR